MSVEIVCTAFFTQVHLVLATDNVVIVIASVSVRSAAGCGEPWIFLVVLNNDCRVELIKAMRSFGRWRWPFLQAKQQVVSQPQAGKVVLGGCRPTRHRDAIHHVR